MTVLKDKMLVRFEFNEDGTQLVNTTEFFNQEWGRLRDICVSPSGKIYLATNGYSWPSQGPNEIIELYNADYLSSDINQNQNTSAVIYTSDLLGRSVYNKSEGFLINFYDDGKVSKLYKLNR